MHRSKSVLSGILVATILSALSACGHQEPSNSSLLSRQRVGTFMALMGGRNSCKQDAQGNFSPYAMSNYPHFKRVVDALIGRGTLVNYLVSCYHGSTAVNHVTSADPTLIQTGNAESTKNQVTSMVANLLPANTYVMGHSYGGWLAMKSALALPQDPGTVAGFYTVDAISTVTCTFARPEGCTAAPADITENERNQLAAKSIAWTNFYQNNTFYLHSSPIRQAHQNLEVDVPHTSIDTDPSVWEKISSEVN